MDRNRSKMPGRLTRLLGVLLLVGCLMPSIGVVGQPVQVALQPCSYAQQFFCIQLHGGAFKTLPSPARFDSGSSALSVPASCLDPDKVTVLQSGIHDDFDRPADLVMGDVAIKSTSGKMLHVQHMHFFALKNVPCRTHEDVGSTFGAFMSGAMSRNTQHPMCATDFLTLYTANQNLSSSTPFGYRFSKRDNQLFITVGQLTSSAPAQQLQTRPIQSCANRDDLALFSGPGADVLRWPGPTVTGFNIMINDIPIPTTPVPNTSDASLTKHLIGMADSGGGMVILSDDTNQTVVNAINSQGRLLSTSNCGQIDWLSGCQCLNAGVPVTITNPSLNISYAFTSTSINDQRYALAVCPMNTGPYIVPNGINPGYSLFNAYDVSFDYNRGRIQFDAK